jgi:phytoene dehydrogenase-like protein
MRRVLVENGQAIGVETDKGETIRAATVAAGINPKLLYLNLVDARAPVGFRRRMENWRCGSGTFRMNVALSELRDFTALPDAHRRNTTPLASSLPRASLTWNRPSRVRLVGRAAPSLNWSFRRQSTTHSRHADSMSRACSALPANLHRHLRQNRLRQAL